MLRTLLQETVSQPMNQKIYVSKMSNACYLQNRKILNKKNYNKFNQFPYFVRVLSIWMKMECVPAQSWMFLRNSSMNHWMVEVTTMILFGLVVIEFPKVSTVLVAKWRIWRVQLSNQQQQDQTCYYPWIWSDYPLQPNSVLWEFLYFQN